MLPVDSRDAVRSLYGSDECHPTMTAEESQHGKNRQPRCYPHQATRVTTIRHGILSGARIPLCNKQTSDQESRLAVKTCFLLLANPNQGTGVPGINPQAGTLTTGRGVEATKGRIKLNFEGHRWVTAFFPFSEAISWVSWTSSRPRWTGKSSEHPSSSREQGERKGGDDLFVAGKRRGLRRRSGKASRRS